MSTALEDKLSNLIHEIREIKKELILQEISRTRIARNKLTAWKKLSKRISSKWDDISVDEEMNYQWDKTW